MKWLVYKLLQIQNRNKDFAFFAPKNSPGRRTDDIDTSKPFE